MAAFSLPRELFDEIAEHARSELPNECCGLVGGQGRSASSVHRARNAFASPLRYEIHPSDQLSIINAIEDAGEELVAIYHSHTESPAYPSQTDVNLARNWPDPIYLICSLAEPTEPAIRGFAIADSEAEEVEVAID